MHSDLMPVLITATIASLVILIAGFLLASIVRRFVNDRKYRKLDAFRQEHGQRLSAELGREGADVQVEAYLARPGSLAWQAVEEVLFAAAADGKNSEAVQKLFVRLGYTAFYEQQLKRRNILVRASAIDKLGRMRSAASLPKLIPQLDRRESEVLAVTVLALGRIGTEEALSAIIERLPRLLGGSLVTRKTMETALLGFGAYAVPFLIGYRGEHTDLWITACILETLSHLPFDARSLSLALDHLSSPNAEVRSKALKVLGRAAESASCPPAEPVVRLLEDPMWFVRLQAAKTAGMLGMTSAAAALGTLLFDKNWRVRGEAALALTRLGPPAIDIFREALAASDDYAKESVCEEIEKAGFSDRLIENLRAGEASLRSRSRDILQTMHRLRFTTPLTSYLENGTDDRIKQEIRSLLVAGGTT